MPTLSPRCPRADPRLPAYPLCPLPRPEGAETTSVSVCLCVCGDDGGGERQSRWFAWSRSVSGRPGPCRAVLATNRAAALTNCAWHSPFTKRAILDTARLTQPPVLARPMAHGVVGRAKHSTTRDWHNPCPVRPTNSHKWLFFYMFTILSPQKLILEVIWKSKNMYNSIPSNNHKILVLEII